jgi:hypothetical protein
MKSSIQNARERHTAARNTGPSGRVGKQRSSGNAFKHGLSSCARRRPDEAAMIAELANALAGERALPRRRQAASDLAEAVWDVLAVYHYKVALLETEIANGGAPRKVTSAPGAPLTEYADAIMRAMPRLALLARYEGRIWARHGRALLHYLRAQGEL